MHQGSISPVKGEQAIYLEFVILGQILPFANPDPKIDLDNYDFNQNEVLLFVHSYNTEIGLFQRLKKKLGYITLRGDVNERFFSYGYNKEKSKVLFCTAKQPIPNIFHCTAFKKHMSYLLGENQKKSNMSYMFMFLPSTLDRKEDIMQFKDNVHLHPVDVSYNDLRELNQNSDFNPVDLDSKTLRQNLLPLFYKYMKPVAEISNHSFTRNSDAYLSSGCATDPNSEFPWINTAHFEAEQKFQLTYQIYYRSKNPNVIKCKVLDYLNTPHESVKLLYVSKYFRKYILNINYKYFYLSTGFCSVKYWDNIFKKNVYILQRNYKNDDFIFTFDFEKTCHEVEVTFCHLSLFSVCFNLLTCLRSCNKVTNYCFYCSRVREHTYGSKSYCHDVVVANQVRSYKDDYMFLQDKIADFVVFLLYLGLCT